MYSMMLLEESSAVGTGCTHMESEGITLTHELSSAGSPYETEAVTLTPRRGQCTRCPGLAWRCHLAQEYNHLCDLHMLVTSLAAL